MQSKKVLVTGIGGNVGQGILRNLRSSNYALELIGSNVTSVSAGNYLCDKVYELPYAYDENYIPEMKSICEKEQIDLIIPSTDYETYYLSKNGDDLPLIASLPFETCEIFVDKYKTYQAFKLKQIPFAESTLPSEFKGQFSNYILKPREGRGSRGLHFNPTDLSVFTDEEYMVQEVHTGKEMTTAFYINKKDEFVSQITLERELQNGTTTFCRVEDKYNDKVEAIIHKMNKEFKLQGACNVQYIVDDKGDLHPFEINGRISGTNSIRSNFGFEDVKWTVEELLFDQLIQGPIKIKKGSASRILLDVVFEEDNLENINSSSKRIIF